MIEFEIDFWKSSTEKTFNEMAEVLIKAGFTEPVAKEFLETIYDAVSGEYGN